MEKEEETVRRFSHNRENCKVKMAENGLAAMFDAFELLAPISKLYSVLFIFLFCLWLILNLNNNLCENN